MVSLYSEYTWPISWQEVQNFMVLVASSTVWKPPQKITPPMAPTTSKPSSEYFELGRLSTSHSRRTALLIGPPRYRSGFRRRMRPLGRAIRSPRQDPLHQVLDFVVLGLERLVLFFLAVDLDLGAGREVGE